MKLREYFTKTKGHGSLSTANSSGRVDSAAFARPHVIDENTVAFVLAHRATYENLQTNPQACYLFFKEGDGYAGKRLTLTKIREEKDKEAIDRFRREQSKGSYERYKNLESTVVFFRVEEVRPLVGVKDRPED